MATSRKQVTTRPCVNVFQSNTYKTGVKASELKLVHMISMKSNCDSLRSSVSRRKRVNYVRRNRHVTWAQTRTDTSTL